jgi:hypothetical protein
MVTVLAGRLKIRLTGLLSPAGCGIGDVSRDFWKKSKSRVEEQKRSNLK